MSNNQRYAQFLFHLSDLGCSLQVSKLRDTARTVLKLMPADAHTIEKFRHVCVEHVRTGATGVSHLLDAMFFNSSPTQVLYNIEVRLGLYVKVFLHFLFYVPHYGGGGGNTLFFCADPVSVCVDVSVAACLLFIS